MKNKFPRTVAHEVATELLLELMPVTLRCEPAGSFRRLKPEVGDLELVYIPKMEERPDGLFDKRMANLALEKIDALVAIGTLAKRPNVNGHFTWGELNRLAIHQRTGLPVDFFATTEADWFRKMVIRTGPKEYNIRLIEAAAKRGLRLHAYGKSLTNLRGEEVPVASEQHLHELCGVPWCEPKDRMT